MTIRGFLFSLMFVFFVSESGFASERTVKFSWRAISRARIYEFELGQERELSVPLHKNTVSEPEIKLKLRVGSYFYRIRGIDEDGAPGPWSDLGIVVVNAKVPVPLIPQAKSNVNKIPEEGIHFQWTRGLKGSKYIFEISYSGTKILTRETDRTEIDWRPELSGPYSWRVGHQIAGEVEWGTFSSFFVIPQALPPKPSKPLTQETLDIEKNQWTAGLGPTFLKYRETSLADINELILTGKIFFSRRLTPQWNIGANLFGNLIHISGSPPSDRVKFLGANVRLGYVLPFIKKPWVVNLMIGAYYSQMLGTPGFGYSPVLYPQLYPTVSYGLSNGQVFSTYFKFVPIGKKFTSVSASERELASGMAWSWPMDNLKNAHIFFDVSSFAIRASETISIQSMQTSLSFGVDL